VASANRLYRVQVIPTTDDANSDRICGCRETDVDPRDHWTTILPFMCGWIVQ
jgi:hypothetical protein